MLQKLRKQCYLILSTRQSANLRIINLKSKHIILTEAGKILYFTSLCLHANVIELSECFNVQHHY